MALEAAEMMRTGRANSIGAGEHVLPQMWSSVTGVVLILCIWEIRKCIRSGTGLLGQEFSIFAPLTVPAALSGFAVGIAGLLS